MELEEIQTSPAKSVSFQFPSHNASETSTLKELIRRLNSEVQKPSGEPITSRTLKRTIDFLRRTIGIDIANGDEPVPASVLKIVRLFFLADLNSSRNLFQLLSPPEADAGATMEFSTVTTIPRDSEASRLVEGLTETLALEIDPARIQMLSMLLGDREAHSATEKLLLHFERTNDEVSAILSRELSGSDALLAQAFDHIAKVMDQFRVARREGVNPPAAEAMYVYLQALPFRHFIQHYPKHLEDTRVQLEIGDICDSAEDFCRIAAGDAALHHGPSSRVLSANTFHHLLLGWPEAMCGLVQQATGIATTVKQLHSHVDRAKRLLISYAYRSFDCTDSGAEVLTLYDVVAALASFRYQQAKGQRYKPYWHGQTEQGTSPQRLFDKGLDPKDPHQHQGVMQIYLNRFYEYQAAFNGTTESYHAWMRYQSATLRAYQSVLELNDIAAISTGLMALNFYCINLAKDVVIEHHRADQ